MLLVMHELTRSGAPLLALRIFDALESATELRTITREGGPLEAEFARLGRLTVLTSYPRFLPLGAGPRERSFAAKGYRYARAPIDGALARRWSPDVVYANTAWSLPILARLGRFPAPVLAHIHESAVAVEIFEAAHPGLLQSLPTSYIAVSQDVSHVLQSRFHVAAESVTVIPPFVELPKDASAPARADAPIVVGGMGYPSWTKGCELWLLVARALLDLLGQHRVRFQWVGVPDNADGIRFRAMVDKLGLGHVVDVVGLTSEPLDYLKKFDVLAITSWEDSAPLVVLDAMACGVPVVCFRGAAGPAEELSGAGVVVDGFAPSAMASAIGDLVDDPDRRRALIAAAHSRVERVYSRAQVVPGILQEIERLVRVGRGSPRALP